MALQQALQPGWFGPHLNLSLSAKDLTGQYLKMPPFTVRIPVPQALPLVHDPPRVLLVNPAVTSVIQDDSDSGLYYSESSGLVPGIQRH